MSPSPPPTAGEATGHHPYPLLCQTVPLPPLWPELPPLAIIFTTAACAAARATAHRYRQLAGHAARHHRWPSLLAARRQRPSAPPPMVSSVGPMPPLGATFTPSQPPAMSLLPEKPLPPSVRHGRSPHSHRPASLLPPFFLSADAAAPPPSPPLREVAARCHSSPPEEATAAIFLADSLLRSSKPSVLHCPLVAALPLPVVLPIFTHAGHTSSILPKLCAGPLLSSNHHGRRLLSCSSIEPAVFKSLLQCIHHSRLPELPMIYSSLLSDPTTHCCLLHPW